MFTFNEATQAIANKPEFTVRDKGEYSVIDYNFNDSKTFVGETPEQTAILLNLRGTAFDNATGKIIRLGFHKFFNYGEQPEIDATLDFTKGTVTQKLDGSCIFPIPTEDGIRLGTRAGVTEISEMAEVFISNNVNYQKFLSRCWNFGSFHITPIFEFCSRKNRVVIDHPEDRLVLIGMRWIDTGDYFSHEDLCEIGKYYGIEVVERRSTAEIGELVAQTRSLENDEGIVVSFPNGHRVKIKADEYVRKHKAVDRLKFEKDVALLFMNNEIDDILPILDTGMSIRVQMFCGEFLTAYQVTADRILELFGELLHTTTDRKSFALAVRSSKYKTFLFQLLDSKETNLRLVVYGILNKWITSKCNTQSNYEEVRKMLDLKHIY